jgi:hypothetical protein
MGRVADIASCSSALKRQNKRLMLSRMKKNGGLFELSATDLVGYLNCRHLSDLDRAVAEGALLKPKVWDPFLQILWERGALHEQN